MAKLRLDEGSFIVPREIFEDVRIDPGDNTQAQCQVLGSSEWVTLSYNWDVSGLGTYIASFSTFTGTVPEFDWETYKYHVSDNEIVAIEL